MPRASPEAMTKPAWPRSCASLAANFRPAPDALREPTTAIIGRISTTDAEQRRCALQCGEPRRIARFARRDQADPKLAAAREFTAGLVLAADTARTRRAAAPREIGQPLQRRTRAAEMTDQRMECTRP